MKKTALWKDTFREIWKSKARFFSIFMIILLGVAFFAGISATGTVMTQTANEYFDHLHLMDTRVRSTLGLNGADREILEELNGADIESFYTLDTVFAETGHTSKMFSYTEDEEQTLNHYRVREGRLPESSGEIALDATVSYREDFVIGDRIQIEEDTDESYENSLAVMDFEVVGFVSSPLYLENVSRGNTQVGSGSLDGFSVILEEDFAMDYRTETFIRFDETEGLEAYSAEYEALVEERMDEIENLYEGRPEERLTELREEIQIEIEDGRNEVESGRQELADAEQELADARRELDEGWIEYEDGLAELEQEEAEARNEIASQRQELEDGRVEIEQARQELNEAQAEVDVGREELIARTQEVDLDAREQELEDGRRQLEQARQELDEAQEEVDEQRAQMEAARETAEQEIVPLREQVENLEITVEEAREMVDLTEEQISQRRAEIESIYEEAPPEEQAELDAELTALDEAQAVINQINDLEENELLPLQEILRQAEARIDAEFQEAEAQLAQGQAEVDAGFEELQSREQELAQGEQQLEQGRQELANADEELQAAQAEIDNGAEELSAQEEVLASGEAALNEAENELENQLADGREELGNARTELEEGESDYEQGRAEFEAEEANALEEIEDAEAELADAEESLNELEEPEYLVDDRSSFSGYEEFSENAERIESIATIFPVFFFLLAALISLTTMTRMVDEGRTQIGTLKALGYTNTAISMKYFVYAFIATVAGGVAGLFIGYAVFPRVIMDAYGSLYNLPSPRMMFFWSYSIIALIGALLATGVSTLLSVRSLLKNNTATLLRPKAPKKGQRILLERIPFVWNHFTFTQKVASRNLFRYKRRMLKTIFGVAGCTALLLTGFGLSDSISDISTLQFGEISQYQAIVMENEEADANETETYEEMVDMSEELDDSLEIYQESITAERNDDSQDVNLIVPEEAERIEEFVVLRDYEDEEVVHQLPEEGAVVTQKLSELLDLDLGDEVTVTDNGSEEFQIEITGIAEHYAQHYLYLSPEAYEAAAGQESTLNARMLKYDENEVDEDELGQEFTQQEAVQGIMFTSMLSDALEDTMDSLDVVTIVLVVSAAALAIVVLYNLTNINVSERIRELSTIKVLGFYDREVTMYVYRENFILTLMGIVAGLLLGVLLHRFVIDTAEVDMVMFSRIIRLTSYLYAGLLTFVFSGLVMIIMHFKLKHVDMVEALKVQD